MKYDQFVDPKIKTSLKISKDQNYLINNNGKKYEIINNIPRFVKKDNYANSFGLQWNKFRKTQLDSHTNTTLSKDRLLEVLDDNLFILKNKKILEAGCGAGRFTEIILKAKPQEIFSIDLSNAVEANYKNHMTYENLVICQASILDLPFIEGSFDFVVCLGVIQHTPNPEETIKKLIGQLRKGGTLLIDHYSMNYDNNKIRKALRKFLIKKSSRFSYLLVSFLTFILWPLHKFFWFLERKITKSNRGGRLRKSFLNISPIVDYHSVYNQLSAKFQYIWSKLDTHDTLTDHFKHLRSPLQIKHILEESNMKIIFVKSGGNGVIAKAIKK